MLFAHAAQGSQRRRLLRGLWAGEPRVWLSAVPPMSIGNLQRCGSSIATQRLLEIDDL